MTNAKKLIMTALQKDYGIKNSLADRYADLLIDRIILNEYSNYIDVPTINEDLCGEDNQGNETYIDAKNAKHPNLEYAEKGHAESYAKEFKLYTDYPSKRTV